MGRRMRDYDDHRPRDLSVCDFFQRDFGWCVDGRGCAADENQTRARNLKSVHDASGWPTVSDGDARPRRERSARTREGIWRGDGAAEALRLAGFADAALLTDDQSVR